MKNKLRFFITITIALLVGMSFWVVGAKADEPQYQEITPDCQGCHQIIREHWESGSHGQAATNPEFLAAWEAQEKPAECLTCHTTGYDIATNTSEFEGVACIACHTPVNNNHPTEVMPTNVSSRDCGNCHVDTFAEWQTSVHAQEDLSCVNCHNSHTTSIKGEDAQALCQSCHSELVHYFENSTHSQEGLLCIDCHVTVSETEIGEGHGQRIHTFTVDMDTCAKCHVNNLHQAPEEKGNVDEAVLQAGLLPGFENDVQSSPSAVSPIGFAILGTLVGVAFGMLLSPWLERWFKSFS